MTSRFTAVDRAIFSSRPLRRTMLVGLFCVWEVLSTTYHVRTDGSNSNPGTTNSTAGAWKSVRYAATRVKAGDAVYVAAGTYVEEEIVINLVGSSSNQTLFKSTDKWGARIVSSTANPYHAMNLNNSVGVVIDGFDISFSNPPGLSDHAGINVGGNWNVIRNCYIHHAPMSGIQGVQCDNLLIEDNVLQANCKHGTTENGSGISIWSPLARESNSGFHIIVRRNICFENEARNPVNGVGHPTDGNGIIMDRFDINAYASPVLIENNLCFNNGGRGIHLFGSGNCVVRNNTCYYNGYVLDSLMDQGDIMSDGGTDNKFYNNIVVGNPAFKKFFAMKITTDNNSTVIVNNLICGPRPFNSWQSTTTPTSPGNTGNLTTTNVGFPKFVNPVFDFTKADFRLQSTSPAINAGTSVSFAPDDLDKKPRPVSGVVDLGAYEFGGSTGNQSWRSVPRNLAPAKPVTFDILGRVVSRPAHQGFTRITIERTHH